MLNDPGHELIDKIFDESTPVDKEALAFALTLMEESDRGCVLVGAAHLDEEVQTLLRETFENAVEIVRKAVDPLLKGGFAPLGSFAARTKLALALGLISSEVHDALEKLRALRNTLAHTTGPFRLSEEQVGSILPKLPTHVQKFWKVTRLVTEQLVAEMKASGKDKGKEIAILSSYRTQFSMAVGFLENEILKSRAVVRKRRIRTQQQDQPDK
jgi:DNA-binding MltR family transcriptional regulator